jgi:hypothetical protein
LLLSIVTALLIIASRLFRVKEASNCTTEDPTLPKVTIIETLTKASQPSWLSQHWPYLVVIAILLIL